MTDYYLSPIERNFTKCSEPMIFLRLRFSHLDNSYLNQMDILNIENYLRSIQNKILTSASFMTSHKISFKSGAKIIKYLPEASDVAETKSGETQRRCGSFWNSIGSFHVYMTFENKKSEDLEEIISGINIGENFNIFRGDKFGVYTAPFNMTITSLMTYFPWGESERKMLGPDGETLKFVEDKDKQKDKTEEDKFNLGLYDWKNEGS